MSIQIKVLALMLLIICVGCEHYRVKDDGCFKGVCVGDPVSSITASTQLSNYLPPYSQEECKGHWINPREFEGFDNPVCSVLREQTKDACKQPVVFISVRDKIVRFV